MRRELVASRQALEAMLGVPVRTLSLPFGEGSEYALRMAREVGYECVLTIEPRMVDPATPAGVMGRFVADPQDWPVEFWVKIHGGYAWRSWLRPNCGWRARMPRPQADAPLTPEFDAMKL